MRLIIVLCFLAAAWAAPVEVPTIITSENNNDGLGRYNFAFQTSDGTKRQEQSEIVNAGDPDKESLIVRGSFSYIGPDGVTYTVTYIADENGFQPSGEHLPTVPQHIIPPETVETIDDQLFTYDPPISVFSLLG